MKKFLALVLAALMVLAVASCGPAATNGDETVTDEKVIKIGVFEPSTGDSASGGKKEILGMQYANSETPTVTIGGEEY